MKDKRRYVQVFVIDPDRKIPVDKSIIYTSDPFVTDSTDEEILFDIDISAMLKKHNEFRESVIDKELSKSRDQQVTLEPIRIRDLKIIIKDIVVF